MKYSLGNIVIAFFLAVFGVFLAVAGIYIGEVDDAPGAALLGILLMIGATLLAARIARRRR